MLRAVLAIPMWGTIHRWVRIHSGIATPILCITWITTCNLTMLAQKTPTTSPGVESISTDSLPDWMTFDMELRGRTEGQTALGVVPGNDHLYELTRVRGGFGVGAPKYFSAYIQFQDKRLMVIAGRQELKFGDERLIGISDWTNVSRTFDVIDTRIGSEQNR